MTSLFYNINSIHDDITVMGNGFMQDSAYYVQIKDYQGNVRAVLDQSHNLVERNEYYPYGGLINASDSQLQPYKYSSKELDRENGLDQYDFSARMYDPMLPMFTSVDPLTEKKPWITPFAYCSSNPINRVDPYGMADYFNLKGDFIYNNNVEDGLKYMVINTSKNVNKIKKAVGKKEYILAPNEEVLASFNNLFANSDNGSTIEQGFKVYLGNITGSIKDGEDNHIDIWGADGKEYDVHIHQWNGPNNMHGLAKASDDDFTYKKDEGISIVLGYGYKPNPNINPLFPTSSISYSGEAPPLEIQSMEIKEIGFFTTKHIKTISYDNFLKASKKIMEYKYK